MRRLLCDAVQSVNARFSAASSPVPHASFLAAPAALAFWGLFWKELGGRVGRNSRPQPKDAFPFFDLLSTQKP